MKAERASLVFRLRPMSCGLIFMLFSPVWCTTIAAAAADKAEIALIYGANGSQAQQALYGTGRFVQIGAQHLLRLRAAVPLTLGIQTTPTVDLGRAHGGAMLSLGTPARRFWIACGTQGQMTPPLSFMQVWPTTRPHQARWQLDMGTEFGRRWHWTVYGRLKKVPASRLRCSPSVQGRQPTHLPQLQLRIASSLKAQWPRWQLAIRQQVLVVPRQTRQLRVGAQVTNILSVGPPMVQWRLGAAANLQPRMPAGVRVELGAGITSVTAWAFDFAATVARTSLTPRCVLPFYRQVTAAQRTQKSFTSLQLRAVVKTGPWSLGPSFRLVSAGAAAGFGGTYLRDVVQIRLLGWVGPVLAMPTVRASLSWRMTWGTLAVMGQSEAQRARLSLSFFSTRFYPHHMGCAVSYGHQFRRRAVWATQVSYALALAS